MKRSIILATVLTAASLSCSLSADEIASEEQLVAVSNPQGVTAIVAGPWIDISDERGGVSIFTHPDHSGFPTDWVLRRSHSMQNAVYPARVPVPLSQTQPLRLRYRLSLHRGVLEAKHIDQYQLQYHAEANQDAER